MMIKKIHFVGTGLDLSSVCKKNVNVWEIDLAEKETASSVPTQPQSFIPLLKNNILLG
jgi:hypothetical protein